MKLAAVLLASALQVAAPASVPDVDAVFSEWTTSTPGCAVGVGLDGRPVLEKGFGMADLERRVPIAGDTIFEAGSVSKQFTAAAVLLLARDGKLALDDDVRRYIPELPAYGTPVTVRHMLTHTSGLRDWGSVAAIGGWPRTTKAYTHAHVLEILSRQKALNFTPGTRWSYSNSGYNLAAILVARVSGMSFAAFTRQRIFDPLGMSSTSWRDDYTRVVPRRALAYQLESDGYHTDMPFENVHGNGGLLTTVHDLLIWNENFVTPRVGDRRTVEEQTTPGRFSDGRAHDYGLGVWVNTYRGTREVRHSGSTAGYRAYLTRFPDLHASVAVLCNAANANADAFTYKVADMVLAKSLGPRMAPTATHTLTAGESEAVAGLYKDTVTGVATRVIREGAGVRLARGGNLVAEGATRFVTASNQRWVFDGSSARVTDAFGTVQTLTRVAPVEPPRATLAEYAGTYTSGEAETTLSVELDGEGLVAKRRPDTVIRLTPVYADAFTGSIGTVVFRRDGAGRVQGLSVSQDRVWDLRFERMGAETSGR
jgi:CubicO group peptidase (beta-lactamase class C family)